MLFFLFRRRWPRRESNWFRKEEIALARNDNEMKKNSVTAKRGVLLLVALAVVCMGLCVVRIGWLTLVKGDEYKGKAEAQQLSVTTLNATRGTIYDSKMNVLAQSASVSLVYVNPSKVDDKNRQKVIASLVRKGYGWDTARAACEKAENELE